MSKKSHNIPAPTQSQSTTVRAQIAQFSGPLPHPEVLAKYDQIIPGAAERIMKMAENDSQHLQEMERTSLRGTFIERRIGQTFGFFIGLAGFAASIWLGALGQGSAAAVVGGSTLIGLVSIFVVGRIYPPQD